MNVVDVFIFDQILWLSRVPSRKQILQEYTVTSDGGGARGGS